MAELDKAVLHEGLAVYRIGSGQPLLLFPYPHGSTTRPMAEGQLAQLLAGLDRQVITFDPPGAYQSTRPMQGDMVEMLACAAEALAVHGLSGPVDVVGHSMGGLCALGLAIEQPELVRRLVLVCSLSGWPATLRWSVPHNWSPWRDRAWWQCMWYGTRQMLGLSNLAVHKRLDNLVEMASFVHQRHVELWAIEPGDQGRPPPPRARWLSAVRRVDYEPRLAEVKAPTLLLAARHDPQTPLACSHELAAGIADARLVVFEYSGHAPFVEEPGRFIEATKDFLRETDAQE